MQDTFSRNELFWGKDFQQKISEKHVAIFGLGGVGGYTAEMLARSGIGELTLVDFDKVSKSNINRQIIALHSTIGELKTDLFFKRLKDINSNLKINVINDFFTEQFNFSQIDFVCDAIDSMRSKINLLTQCYEEKIPVISSMGAGNRVDPTKLYISDISEIHNKKAPFVSNVLYQLKKRNIISGITVVTSDENPHCEKRIEELEQITANNGEIIEFNKIIPSSTPFVASCAGIFMASYVIQHFMKN